LKTRIYIDGYNLYYGCLKGTPYKWLDLTKSFTDYIIYAHRYIKIMQQKKTK